MDELELLQSIRLTWLHRAVTSLAHGSNVRENLRPEMEQFFTLLEHSVETGDPSWLDPILISWPNSLTEDDLVAPFSHLSLFLSELMENTVSVCRDSLSQTQALDLITILTPIWGYAFRRLAEIEIEAKYNFSSIQLQQVRQTLEKLDRSKSDFISIAAHELKTPLTLVDGYTNMLKEALEHSNAAAPTDYELINGISNGTRRLQDIINDMIDVSMIDNNLLSLNFQPVWINQILSFVEDDARSAVAERRQKLEIVNIPGAGEATYADPERLLQVFRNLTSNAIKYTPDGGKIRIFGRKLPGFIEICIQDTGIGISPEDQTTIFEKFSRLGNSALHSSGKVKFKGGGPGLGLHITKGIIEAHGGTIWVESPGHDEKTFPGSTFHVFIPMRTAQPDDKSAILFQKPSQK